MTKNIIIIIIFLIFYSKSFAQCDDFIKENKRLINEKNILQKKHDNLETDFDKLFLKYQAEVAKRINAERKYLLEVVKNTSLKLEIEILEDETDSLREILVSLPKKQRDSLNLVIYQKEKKIRRKELQLNTQDSVINILSEKIEILESELKDRISIKEEIVYFDSKQYKYGNEIIFIEFEENSSKKYTIKQNDKYLLIRLANLASKYDFRVKIKLTGHSMIKGSNRDSRKKRKELAIQRAAKIKTFLIDENLLLTEDCFSDLEYINSYSTRKGVSICIVRR